MGWMRLPDGRSILPSETVLEFEGEGGRYRITGPPIGYGGSGILYPAVRITRTEKGWKEEEMRVALKECYPLVRGDVLVRDGSGRIRRDDSSLYLYAKEMMRREKAITGQIYNKGFRLVPLWGIAEKELISLDGKQFAKADNLYGIMERLDEKGVSLGRLLQKKKKGCFTAYESICIINQVLRSLGEVHENGFLHGDIQENNIFMKGNNEEKDELGIVSLIDFGSARSLQEDGATGPIEDRNLYTTSGYAAPECINKNDGTLRLTKAADLYSVGYLMLRMFTGKALDARALQLVVNDKYFYERQAKKIGCPSGSVESVNKILLKALQKDPARRYQTAEEMLEDTLRLERALSPKKSAIASVDYRAFISYCHEEKSMQAAEAIQKLIERYKIPKAVRPADGRKRLGKVFRDREELSSSNDMEVHLKEALAHSEYLIVLLSPGVPSSPWVCREIEMFLEYHDREHILTMIVEGEPEEVFPEQLCQDEKYDGRNMKLQRVESLAADIRGDTAKQRRKRLKTEIYRLLAPMLGCGYDDLRQRQKEYRQRRLLRTMTAAVVFLGIIAGYVGWQAYQIHENYWATLVKQSRYLAQVSSELLSRGDRLKAIAVAMEALPSGQEDHSRPLVEEAEASLAQALYCYQGSDRASYLKADRMLSMGEPSAELETLSPDGGLLLTADQGDTVYLWNISTGACEGMWDTLSFYEHGAMGELVYCDFLNEEEILVVTQSYVASIGIEDQELRILWELEEKIRAQMSFCALSEDGSLLAILDMDMEMADSLTVYRTDTGEEVESIPLEALGETWGEDFIVYTYFLGEMVFDAQGRYLAAAFYGPDWEENPNSGILLLADLEQGSYQIIEDGEMRCQNVCFLGEDRIAVFGCEYDLYGDIYEVTVPGKISCYDPQSGELLWKKELICQRMADNLTGMMNVADQTSTESRPGTPDELFVWSNRELLFLDGETGEERWSCTCEDSIVGVQAWRMGYIVGTESGAVFSLDLEEKTFVRLGTNVKREVSSFLFSDEKMTALLISAEEGAIVLLKQIADTDYEMIEHDATLSLVSVPLEGSYYMISSREEDETYKLTFYEKESHTETGSIPVENRVTEVTWINRSQEAGTRETLCYVEDSSTYSSRLTAYDVPEQKVQWQTEVEYRSDSVLLLMELEEALLYSEYDKGRTGTMEILDLQTGKVKETVSVPSPAGMEDAFDSTAEEDYTLDTVNVDVSASGRYILALCKWKFYPEDYGMESYFVELKTYDRETKSWMELPQGAMDFEGYENSGLIYGSIFYMAQEKDIVAVYEETRKQLNILDLTKMEIISQIPFYGNSQRAVAFLPGDEKLLLWGDDGYLKLWDMEEECILMEDTQKLYGVSAIDVENENGLVAINGKNDSTEEFSYVLSMDRWYYLWDGEDRFYPYIDIRNSFYSEGLNQFGCSSLDGSEYFWYDYYTLDELLEKAREVTGDYTLTKAERMKYFIEELRKR